MKDKFRHKNTQILQNQQTCYILFTKLNLVSWSTTWSWRKSIAKAMIDRYSHIGKRITSNPIGYRKNVVLSRNGSTAPNGQVVSPESLLTHNNKYQGSFCQGKYQLCVWVQSPDLPLSKSRQHELWTAKVQIDIDLHAFMPEQISLTTVFQVSFIQT